MNSLPPLVSPVIHHMRGYMPVEDIDFTPTRNVAVPRVTMGDHHAYIHVTRGELIYAVRCMQYYVRMEKQHSDKVRKIRKQRKFNYGTRIHANDQVSYYTRRDDQPPVVADWDTPYTAPFVRPVPTVARRVMPPLVRPQLTQPRIPIVTAALSVSANTSFTPITAPARSARLRTRDVGLRTSNIIVVDAVPKQP